MSSSTDLRASENPSDWRFTWEAQSHTPTLRLFLFDLNTKPSCQCTNLEVKLVLEQSLLVVSFFEDEVETSLRVPIPRVLVDVEAPVQFSALDDHIEIKLVLLLPVDHPIGLNFESVLNLSEDYESAPRNVVSDELRTLSMDSGSEVKNLSSMEEVHFYCRNCSNKLTRSLRFFKEMPSVNWREVADNWFGACCCSFGGISEKLVTKYAESYACAAGVCLLSTTSLTLCKDDLVGCKFPDLDSSQDYESELNDAGGSFLIEVTQESGSKHESIVSCENLSQRMQDLDEKFCSLCPRENNPGARLEHEVIEKASNGDSLSYVCHESDITRNMELHNGCHADIKKHIQNHDTECCTHDSSETSPKEPKCGIELLPNQKIFLNGYLGNGFMARSSNLSKDVSWIEFPCPHCSYLLGAYPCINGCSPLDGGVRLLKCYISTCLPVGGSSDLFRNYTLERMFTNQLLESAEDELSFRTVVKDLHTKCPVLQLVLLNPHSWCSTGYCLSTMEPVAKMDIYPTIKVLFSDCSNGTEFQIRNVEEWITKNQADEVYMLASQIKELIEFLESANNVYPPSHSFLQGLLLSSLRR
ncbi:unnamed protein product [Ilex paraguariensis]|uniref:Ubiquitin-conjugating enzyme E2C-binding protein n=1 Tax=Ilex paraguariensis TaxID=185542 RepID=A0ABC8SJL8_9AQUA